MECLSRRTVRTGLQTDRKLRELGICTVALLTGADYEYAHHAPDFLAAGGTQQALDCLWEFCAGVCVFTIASLGVRESLVIRYAAEMTRHVKVSDRLFAEMKQQFTTVELAEITAAIATYNMVARFLVALAVTVEQ